MICVYGIENTINGKWYIGQTKNLAQRRRQHLWRLRDGSHGNKDLQNDWNLFGENAFKLHCLEECSDDRLLDKERYWISKKNSYEYGYNLTTGGLGPENLVHSEESRQKMSTSQTGRKHSEQTKKRMSESAKHSERNKRHLEEMFAAKRERTVTAKEYAHLKSLCEKQKKPVLCVETGVVYESAHDAARKNNTHQSSISLCCRGGTKTHKGLHWKYIESEVAYG